MTLETLVREFGWIHMSVGLLGNIAFVVGSVLFLPTFEPIKTVGVWLFIAGSFLMFVGAAGNLALKLYEKHEDA